MRFLNALRDALLRLLLPGGVLLAMSFACVIAYKVSGSWASLDTTPVLLPYIAAPVLTLSAFSFLFKRNASDTFFSLPIKRSTLFLSSICAIILWMLALLVPYVVGRLFTVKDGHILFEHILPFILYYLKSGPYYMSVFLLGAVLTGRRFSAVINGLLILFVPLNAYQTAVALIFKRLAFLLSGPDMPMLYSYPFRGMYLLTGTEKEYFYIIATIVYIALAFILFIKRRSETAQKSAPNRILRIVYGSMIAFSFVLIVIGIQSMFQPDISFYIIVYGVAALLTILYGFLSVKRLSGVWDGLISIGASALVCVLMLSICSLYVTVVRNQKIEVVGYQLVNYVDKDESRQEVNGTYQWGLNYESNGLGSFSYTQLKDYFITDEKNCELVEDRFDELREAGTYPADGRRGASVVLLDKNGKRYYRTAYFTEDEITDLTKNYFLSDPEYLRLASTLPDPDTVTHVDGGRENFGDKEVYELFYREMMALSEKERIACTYKIDTTCPIALKAVTLDRIYVRGVGEDGEIYEMTYGIFPEYHPETYKKMEELLNKENFTKALEYLQIKETEYPRTRLIFTYTPKNEEYPNRSGVGDETASVNLSFPYQISITNKNNPLSFKKDRFPDKILVLRQNDTSDMTAFLNKVEDIIKNRTTDDSACTLTVEYFKKQYSDKAEEITFHLDLEYGELVELIKMIEEVDF